METAQERFARDWLTQRDDRKLRGWDQRTQERNDREYYPHGSTSSDLYSELYNDNY